uniref:Uncharacterized protein n=1 Tax=Octopus bimaculoides TaxID=37653 RepID=A0A0L8FL42_OCTBM
MLNGYGKLFVQRMSHIHLPQEHLGLQQHQNETIQNAGKDSSDVLLKLSKVHAIDLRKQQYKQIFKAQIEQERKILSCCSC